MTSYKEKLNHITTFIFDVDGVLTTGEVIISNGNIIRTLHSRDGYALQFAAKLGYRIIIITGGSSEDVKDRLLGLGATEVFLRAHHKMAVYNDCKEKYGFEDKQALYMGDDIPDYPVMKVVGLSTCPQDAAVEIKEMADYQSPINGGKGCVRDVIEQCLRVQGKWELEERFTW